MRVDCVACGARATVPGFAAGCVRCCPQCGTILPCAPSSGRFKIIEDDGSGGALDQLALHGDERALGPPDTGAGGEHAHGGSWRRWIMPVVGGVVAVIFLAVSFEQAHFLDVPHTFPQAGAMPSPSPDSWSRSVAMQFMVQKSSADELAMAGKWHQAYGAYEGILRGAAQSGSRDPLILWAADGARLAQDQVLAAIMREKVEAPGVASTQPVTFTGGDRAQME